MTGLSLDLLVWAAHKWRQAAELSAGACCSWDVRLAALKGYYGQPKSTIFPFAYLNPGGYISNVTFWLNALKDYELGKVSYNTSHRFHSDNPMTGCSALPLRWLLLTWVTRCEAQHV